MKKQIRMPSTGTVIAFIALVVAMSGVAVAAKNQIGGKDIKASAIKTSKIKNGAVTNQKLAGGAVTADKLAPGAVSGGSLADGSVTGSKLEPGERSEAFTANHGQVALPGGADTVAIQTALPTPGNFVVTVSAQIGNQSGAVNFITCDLLDANNPLATGVTSTTVANTFQSTLSLTGVSDGGIVRLRCNPSAGATTRNLVLTATRVNTVTPLTSTP